MASAVRQDANCPICMDKFNCPATLHCGHSLCLQCLIDESGKVEKFTCPRCRAVFSSRSLPKGRLAVDIVEQLISQHGMSKPCELCHDKKAAGGTFCLRCEMFICESHVESHMKNERFTAHVLVAPGTLRDGQAGANQNVSEGAYHNKSGTENSVIVHKDFHLVYGKSLPLVTPSDYVKVIAIVEKPNVQMSKTSAIVNMLLPYIMQVVKMWGVSILHAAIISELAQEDMETCHSSQFCKGPNFAKTSSKAAASSLAAQTRALNEVPLSRLDCLVALLSSADCTVVQDLIQILSKFPVALPLVMPNLEKKGEYKVMLPLIIGNTVKWEVQSGVIIENDIFTNPFILILAVRLGNSTCGKSTILNQLMAVENMFSSCGEPGARRGRPLTLNGTVEFTWLTEETCGAGLWKSVLQQFYARGGNEVVLLANLHGDASEYPEVIQFFKNVASTYVVFMMPEKGELLKEKWNTFVQLSGSQENIHYLMVDPDEDCNEAEEIVIQTTRLTNDDTLKKVRAMFKRALNSAATKIKRSLKPDMSNFGNTLQLRGDKLLSITTCDRFHH